MPRCSDFTTSHLAFLEQLTASIGIVLNSIEATMQTEGLLKQSQQLAGELQAQQKELQQTNEQLEQKAQQLAERNVEVERKNQEIEQARRALEEKATELALTSKYKSEFLANMSHELRTPLNCILILGQQLAENPDGNLTAKQVEFARTIHGAGTDLLNLISDILDLSKIESGTVTVDAEEIFFSNLLDTVARPFRHEAENRQLVVRRRDRSAPRPQHHHRLQAPAAGAQEPAVERLQVHRAGRRAAERLGRRGRLERRPSGARTSRVGGGLRGLRHRHRHPAGKAEASSSRRSSRPTRAPAANTAAPASGLPSAASLPNLLGGEIQLRSAPGIGSTFTLYLPLKYVGPDRCVARAAMRPARSTASREFAAARAERPVEHDPGRPLRHRSRATPILLIVEDDPHYARILVDLARDNGFKVLVGDARRRCARPGASSIQPTAVSLDVFLPDMLGWTVLSQLKQNPLTRHIPVQIVTLDEDRQHGAGARRFLVRHQADDDRGRGGGAGAHQGIRRRRGASACWSWRTTPPSS